CAWTRRRSCPSTTRPPWRPTFPASSWPEPWCRGSRRAGSSSRTAASTGRRSSAPSRRARSARADALRERPGELRTPRLVLVLEEDEGPVPGLGLDAVGPGRHVRFRVVRTPQAQVTPVRGDGEVGERLLVRVGQAERGSLVTQRLPHLVVEPGGVAELEGGAR